MFDNSTDRGSAPRGAQTGDLAPTHQRPLLGATPVDVWPPPLTAGRPEPAVHPTSVLDRLEPRTFGMIAVGVLSGLLLGVAALSLIRSGGDASTAAGSEVTLPVDAPTAPGPDPSQDDGSDSPSSAFADTSTTSVPSTTVATTSTTVITTATTAASTTTPPSTETSSMEPDPTTSTTAPPTTDQPSTETTLSTTTPSTEPPPSTTAAPSTTTRPDTSGDDAAIQRQVLDATNAERAAAGCGPLRLDATLNGAADAHSEDMAARNYFDHSDPEGRGPGDRINASGYPHQGWGENIAAGYGSAEAVVDGWMNSSGHRANILNCSFDELGVGYAEPGRYWTQLFATRR